MTREEYDAALNRTYISDSTSCSMNAGSKEAIWYELRNGTVWTVVDELWHAVEWLAPSWHGRFCNWSHEREENKR